MVQNRDLPPHTLTPPPHPAPGPHRPAFCLHEFDSPRDLRAVESHVLSFCARLFPEHVALKVYPGCGRRQKVLVKAEQYSAVCMCPSLFIRSSVVDAWVASTLWLLMMPPGQWWTGVCPSSCFPFAGSTARESGIAGSHGNCDAFRNLQAVFHGGCPSAPTPPAAPQWFPVLTNTHFLFFDNSCSNGVMQGF